MKYTLTIGLLIGTLIADNVSAISMSDAIATRSKGCQEVLKLGDSMTPTLKNNNQCKLLSSPEANIFLVASNRCSKADLEYLKNVGCGAAFQAAIKTRSQNCQDALTKCTSKPLAVKAIAQGKYCALISDPMAKSCLVANNSKCVEKDIGFVKDAVCVEAAIPTQDPTMAFVAIIGTRPMKCQQAFTRCSDNEVSKTLMASGKFCQLLSNPLAQDCIVATDKCSKGDFDFVKSGACKTTVITTTQNPGSAFMSIIATRPNECQQQFQECSANGAAKSYIAKDQYCLLLSLSITKACLVTSSGCLEKDFEYVKSAACSAGHKPKTTPAVNPGLAFMTIIATQPKECQQQFQKCSSSDVAKSLMASGQYCLLLSNPLAKSCLITSSGCLEKDFEYVKSAACSASKPQTTPAVNPGLAFMAIIATQPKECQQQFQKCSSSDVAKSLMASGQYCLLLSNPLAKSCLVTSSGCLEKDFEFVKSAACSAGHKPQTTPVSTPSTTNRQEEVMGLNPLSPAVNRLPKSCQKSFWACLKVLPQVRYWVDQRFYCRAMRLHQATMCMVATGDCRERDLDQLRAATCQGIPEDTLGDNNNACMKNTCILTMILVFLAHLVF